MNNKSKKYGLLILLFLIIGISIGYSSLSTTLNINGNTVIEKASWDVHFENLEKVVGSESATQEALIDSSKTLIEYIVLLLEPGDFYEFTVDIVNSGSIDAMVNDVLKTGLATSQENYIEYTATYADGVDLEENDILKSGETQKLRVRVKYKEDINVNDLPSTDELLDLKFQIIFIQADDNAKEKSKYVCKRATSLHTEECSQTDATLYCSGAGYSLTGSKGTTTITFGKLGNKGDLPVSGDSFDCDVNGDGIFDSEKERFYYIGDSDIDSNYASLIYYNNTTLGKPDSLPTSLVAYDLSGENWHGPTNAISYLPTASQWSNITLNNPIRSITNEIGVNTVFNGTYQLPTQFSYSGYVARLLTRQELNNVCNVNMASDTVGLLDNCSYLMEKTMFANSSSKTYGYWLENPSSDYKSVAEYVNGYGRYIKYYPVDKYDLVGVRPVIEVLKTDISY